MPNASCEDLAREILERCISGDPPARLPQPLLEEPCAAALFGILAEGLSDRFEPASLDALFASEYTVSSASDRSGLRLEGAGLRPSRSADADAGNTSEGKAV